MTQNFSPLPEKLLQVNTSKTSLPHKEAEPLLVESKTHSEETENTIEEQVEAETSQDVSAAHMTVVPEKPQVTKEQEDLGVTAASASIFVQGKKITMPLTALEFEVDLKKPMTTGARWMAEIVRYLLQKFHVTVKRISGIFQFVNQ